MMTAPRMMTASRMMTAPRMMTARVITTILRLRRPRHAYIVVMTLAVIMGRGALIMPYVECRYYTESVSTRDAPSDALSSGASVVSL